MNNTYSDNLEEIATYGFDSIDPDEKVEVNLKDLMYVFSTLQEFQRFFINLLIMVLWKILNAFWGQ